MRRPCAFTGLEASIHIPFPENNFNSWIILPCHHEYRRLRESPEKIGRDIRELEKSLIKLFFVRELEKIQVMSVTKEEDQAYCHLENQKKWLGGQFEACLAKEQADRDEKLEVGMAEILQKRDDDLK